MAQQHKLTNYVSEIDQFLQEFDKVHPNLSRSQQKEKAQYCRIYALRDSAENQEKAQSTFLDDF